MLVGRYAGEVQDIEPVTARELLVSGRGEDPDAVKTGEPAVVTERLKNKPRK
jgi:hypothetical protein